MVEVKFISCIPNAPTNNPQNFYPPTNNPINEYRKNIKVALKFILHTGSHIAYRILTKRKKFGIE